MPFSGLIGSGLCVFSRHPIQEILQHVYTLNGYPYMVRVSPLPPLTQARCRPPRALGRRKVAVLSGSVFGLQLCHGDWFCGKAVGLLVLHLNGVVLNAYVTHVSETSQV